MKDKLTKTGRKKAYYRFRFLGRASVLIMAIAIACFAPVMITYEIARAQAEAETQTSLVSSESTPEVSETSLD